MRISNLLHFTENHRFCVRRDFALGGMDYRMLTAMYQPMVGAFAMAVYLTLNQQLPSERVGYSGLEQQRKLFLALDLELSESGRKLLIDMTSKLEAVGLLQTSRRFVQEGEDYLYEYTLLQPLGPIEFYRNQHLTLLLRDKIGKYAVLALKEELLASEPDELFTASCEQLSVPFYDIFRLNTQVIDHELEQAMYPAPTPSGIGSTERLDTTAKGYDYADIIMRFPRGSRNRSFVEQFKYRPDQLAAVNLAARKYELTLQETCRLLDEDGVFDEDGTLLSDVLQYRASLFSRQAKRRSEQLERELARKEEPQEDSDLREEKAVEMAYYLEVPPMFQGQCDQHQYNMLLRNEPYTRVLQRFFPQGKVPDGVADVFEKVDLSYKLREDVINVMIHYIHIDRSRSWSKTSVEQLASDLMGRHIGTYEQAVEYVREKRKQHQEIAQRLAGGSRYSGGGSGAGKSGKPRGSASQKPKLPVASSKSNVATLTAEELDHIRMLARKLQEG